MKEVAWFRVTMAECWIAEGQRSAFFGHRLDSTHDDRNGVFWQWRFVDDTLTIENDYLGFSNLFYCHSDRQFIVSPSIEKLLELGAEADFDFAALGVFFRLGFFLNEETPFQAIKCLPPNCTLVWKNGNVSMKSSKPALTTVSLSHREAIQSYDDLFQQAMRRRAPHGTRPIIPLSGGRDSRHILLESQRQGFQNIEAVTTVLWQPKPNDDVDVARKVAQKAAVRHHLLTKKRSPIRDEVAKNRATQFCSDEHAAMISVATFCESHATDVYDGIGGDVLSAGLFSNQEYQTLFDRGQLDQLAVNLLAFGDDWIRSLVGGSAIQLMHPDDARNTIVDSLRSYEGCPDAIAQFYFWSRTRREMSLAPYGVMATIPQVFAPFLDSDLYDFLTAIPADFAWNKEFHTETIAASFPNWQDVGYSSWPGRPSINQTAKAFFGLMGYAGTTSPTLLPNVGRTTYRLLADSLRRKKSDFNWRLMLYWTQLCSLGRRYQ